MVKSLICAYKNTGVLDTNLLSDPVAGLAMIANDITKLRRVNNDTENLDCAFAVDEVFKGASSYIDSMDNLEDLDPSVVFSAVGAFENNEFVGTSTGAEGEENVVNLKNMLANNLDLNKNGESSDVMNGNDIFDKFFDAVSGNSDTDDNFITHAQDNIFAFMDGHTQRLSGAIRKHIGTGEVAANKTTSTTEKIYFDGTEPTDTSAGSLQTEVAFTVLVDGETKTILSKTTDEKENEDQTAFGETDTVSVDANSGNLKGSSDDESVAIDSFQFDWDGIPCSKVDLTLSQKNKPLNIPNNTSFRVCHEVTIKSGTTFIVQPGAKVEIASGGSIVVESGATVNINEGIVNIAEGGVITVEGTLNNNFLGIIKNNGTINSSGTFNNNSLINNNADGDVTDAGTVNQERSGNVGTIHQTGGVFNNNSGAIINNTGIIKIQSDESNEITMNNTGTINNQSGSEIRISSPGRKTKDKKYLINKKGGIINTVYESIIRIYNERGLQNYGTINHNGIIIEEGSIIKEDIDGKESEEGGTAGGRGFYYQKGTLTTTNDENKVRIFYDLDRGTDGEGRSDREALEIVTFGFALMQYLALMGLKWSPNY